MSICVEIEVPDGPIIHLTEDVLRHLDAHRQRSWIKCEAGGQLFARVRANRWSVDVATGPRKTDWRSRFGYRPNRKAEREEIKLQFAAGFHFVGDWHTHPQRIPQASGVDLRSMDEMVVRSEHTLPGFLLLIVGTRPFPDGLWASFHRRMSLHEVLRPRAMNIEVAPVRNSIE